MLVTKSNDYVKILNTIHNHCVIQRPEFLIYKKRIEYIKAQMQQQEFRITVVGEFSAGKSTFLNALIGKDVLPHAVRETTASVTYIRNVDASHDLVNKMEIKFANIERESVVLDIASNPSALKEYVTTMSNDFNVVKEISAVHIYLNFPYTNEPIVFVDTPGLNGMAEGHYDLTLSEIQKAHASIFLFPIRGLSKTNIRLLKLLSQYQEKFIFVMNFIDELKKEEGETVEGKLNQLTSDLQNVGITKEIQPFGVSALKALVAKDLSIKRLYASDEVDIEDLRRNQLLEESNFAKLEDYIWNKVILKEKEKILIGNIDRNVKQIVSEVIEELEELLKLNAAKIDHEDRLEVEERIKRLATRSDKNWQTTNAYIGSRENDLSRMFREKVQEDLNVIQDDFEQKIRRLTYKQFDLFKENVEKDIYQNELSTLFTDLKFTYENSLESLLDDVFHGAILKIRKFHPSIIVQSNHKIEFLFDMNEANFEDLSIDNKLKAMEDKEKDLSQEFHGMIKEKSKAELELEKASREVTQFSKKEQELISEKNKKIKSLGSIPDVYRYKERRTREVERHEWSPFRLFGSTTKTETYTATVTDDSDQRKWKNSKGKIEQEYKNKLHECQLKQADYEERKRRLERDHIENARKIEQVNRRLKEVEQEKRYLEKLQTEIYEKNKREYFEIQKRDLLKIVHRYVNDVIRLELEDLLLKNLETNIIKIKNSAKTYYIDSETKYKKKLQTLLKQTKHDFNQELDKEIKEAIKEFSKLQYYNK